MKLNSMNYITMDNIRSKYCSVISIADVVLVKKDNVINVIKKRWNENIYALDFVVVSTSTLDDIMKYTHVSALKESLSIMFKYLIIDINN